MDCRRWHWTTLWIRATSCEPRPLTCKDGSSTGTDWKEEVTKMKKNRINASSCNCTTVLYYRVFNCIVINPMNTITHAITATKMRNFQIEWPVTILPSLRYNLKEDRVVSETQSLYLARVLLVIGSKQPVEPSVAVMKALISTTLRLITETRGKLTMFYSVSVWSNPQIFPRAWQDLTRLVGIPFFNLIHQKGKVRAFLQAGSFLLDTIIYW